MSNRVYTSIALDDLTIHVDRGQILGFIGPNGAGKTTTIKILVGLSRPTSGNAWIAGVNCSGQASKIKHLVGYMPDRQYSILRWGYGSACALLRPMVVCAGPMRPF